MQRSNLAIVRFGAECRGVTALEYAVIAAIVVVAALTGAKMIGDTLIMGAGQILAAL